MASNLKEHLKGLPEYCRLVPLGGWEKDKVTGKWVQNLKAPIKPGSGENWRNCTYNLDEVCKIKKTGIGCVQGELGGGLVFIDPDGDGSEDSFE